MRFARSARPVRHAVIAGFAAIALVAAGCSANPGGPGLQPAPFPSADGTPQSAANVTTAALAGQQNVRARIALLAPLSAEGQTAAIAKGLKQAGELALFDVDNPGLQLIVKDTGGTAAGATRAATEALAAGAEVIIGPLFSESVRAAAVVARQANVPIVAFSSNTDVAGNGVYLLSFLARQEVDRIVVHAARQGRSRFAALIPDTTYGKVLRAEFERAVASQGATIVAVESYPPGANGMLEQAQKLFETVSGVASEQDDSASSFTTAVPAQPLADVVFVPGDASTLPVFGPIMRNAKVDPRKVLVIGNGGWDYPNIGRTQAFVGGRFAAPDPNGFEAFSQRFARTFGSAPPRIASFAYDGVSLAASLAARAEKGQRYTPASLTQASGYTGVDGPVRFLPSGVSERALAVLEVGPRGLSVIEPAATQFGVAPFADARNGLSRF